MKNFPRPGQGLCTRTVPADRRVFWYNLQAEHSGRVVVSHTWVEYAREAGVAVLDTPVM
jgi:hypothetical protein